MTISNQHLLRLCIQHKWFTSGSNKQYEKLFKRNTEPLPLTTLATILWMFSTGWKEQDILDILQKEAF